MTTGHEARLGALVADRPQKELTESAQATGADDEQFGVGGRIG